MMARLIESIRRNPSEFTFILLVAVLGISVYWIGSTYSPGTLRRIGPGFFPMVIGLAIAGFAVALFLEALRSEPVVIDVKFLPFVAVVAGAAAFGALVERWGLIPATFALVFISAFAEKPLRPVQTLLTAVVLSAAGVALFIYGLAVPLQPVRF